MSTNYNKGPRLDEADHMQQILVRNRMAIDVHAEELLTERREVQAGAARRRTFEAEGLRSQERPDLGRLSSWHVPRAALTVTWRRNRARKHESVALRAGARRDRHRDAARAGLVVERHARLQLAPDARGHGAARAADAVRHALRQVPRLARVSNDV